MSEEKKQQVELLKDLIANETKENEEHEKEIKLLKLGSTIMLTFMFSVTLINFCFGGINQLISLIS